MPRGKPVASTSPQIDYKLRMLKYIDLETWPRRELFNFFINYANPYFNVCTKVDVTRLLSIILVYVRLTMSNRFAIVCRIERLLSTKSSMAAQRSCFQMRALPTPISTTISTSKNL